MTATEILRRMLDERRVEYETYTEQPTGFEHVKWNFNEHGSADFNLEFGEPWLTMYGVISGPAQAIAATLGAGTCHVECFDDGIDEALDGSPIYTTPTWYLSCGHTCEGAERPSFCKNCGRRVVDA